MFGGFTANVDLEKTAQGRGGGGPFGRKLLGQLQPVQRVNEVDRVEVFAQLQRPEKLHTLRARELWDEGDSGVVWVRHRAVNLLVKTQVSQFSLRQ